MAEASAVSARIDHRLQSVRRSVEALAWFQERWTSMARDRPTASDDLVGDQMGLRAEWRDLMDRLEWVDRRLEAWQMSSVQAQEEQRLLVLIGERPPLIERVPLQRPPRAALERLEAIGAAGPTRTTVP